MALPASGAISLNDVNVELGNTATVQIDMNSAAVRGLFGVASGAISMSDGYGKSSVFDLIISSNVSNANLATLATAAGWDGTSELTATLNSGIYCSSTSTGTPALTINGSFPNGVTFTNNGTIVGMGGRGGNATPAFPNGGLVGGLALSVSSAVSITNNGIIAGGGGGGGAGGRNTVTISKSSYTFSGGGGGGGRSSLTNSAGGSGGNSSPWSPAAAGGAGTISAAGAGSAGQTGAGYSGASSGGNGGGWGASGTGGGPGSFVGAGAGGGAATSGSGTYITWLATGTRYGSIG